MQLVHALLHATCHVRATTGAHGIDERLHAPGVPGGHGRNYGTGAAGEGHYRDVVVGRQVIDDHLDGLFDAGDFAAVHGTRTVKYQGKIQGQAHLRHQLRRDSFQ